MMVLQPPAGVDDFGVGEGQAALRQTFQRLWNSNAANDGYLGYYVSAAAGLRNYVDPRAETPPSDPIPVPWNGFPKAISRWVGDETSPERREQAETIADVLAPVVYWVQPNPSDPSRLRLFSTAVHRLPYFVDRLGGHVARLAGPRRLWLADGSVGPELKDWHRQQDEYLEWHAETDASGKLIALTLTAEPPDYWSALAQVSRDKVVELYRRYVSRDVREEDLFFQTDLAVAGIDLDGQAKWIRIPARDEYNTLNPWTTTRGIMHLTHPANTLGAEVNLAKEASVVMASDALPEPALGEPGAEIRRIVCGGYGGINRSSDPLIGLGVGDLVNGGHRITLTDPVGLYISRCDLSSLAGPNGVPLGIEAMTLVRGTDHPTEPRMLRLRIEIPRDRGFSLGDCTIEGRELRRGGQVARVTTMAIYAQIYPGGVDTTVMRCDGRPCAHPVHANLFTTSVVQQGEDVCPTEADPIWLLDRPYDGEGAAGAMGLAPEAGAAPGTVRDLPVSGATAPVALPPKSRSPLGL